MRPVAVLIPVLCISAVVLLRCQPGDRPLPGATFEAPAHFPAPAYSLSENPLTPAGFLLGKKLFYDGILSRDSSISCASCHQSYAAFAHQSHAISHGIDDLLGTRNAPALQNLAWSTHFFWDGGAHDLDVVPINAITNPVEMDEYLSHNLRKLRAHPEYPKLFKKAFGNEEITTELTMKALSQFMIALISAGSPYDRYLQGENTALDPQQLRGLAVFRQHCASCHSEPLLTDNQFHNNGLLVRSTDPGRYAVTLDPADRYLFKTPSLRNIAKTAPYMHNGRISTLEKAVEHYRSGIQASATLDARLTGGLSFSDAEKADLLAFLEALTDEGFLNHPDFVQ